MLHRLPVAALLFLTAAGLPVMGRAAQRPSTAAAMSSSVAPAPAASTGTPATVPAADGAAEPAVVPPVLDAQDLGPFLDGLVPYLLRRDDVAGGVIAVVKDGKLIFDRGYGYANVKERSPVIPDQTLFRIGSVSKLFTWTAVMQLVAAGKINLNANVDQYLDFKIPPAFGKPITMRDLMTMTPGFAETVRDLMAPTPKKLIPLRQYLVEHLPRRIFPPGEVVAYSNYGAALAGYIVQRVSGEPFDTYVEDHILKPLGMMHSTFAQPLPPALSGRLSTGYITATDKTVVPFEAVQPWPAGSFTSSATDMAKFMIMELQDGQFDGASILPPAAIKLMHTRHYAPALGMNGYDLGFYQLNRNGLRIIGHGGDTIAFHSDLVLLPDQHIGIFMSFNSAGKGGGLASLEMRTAILHALLDRYFPYTPPSPPTVASAARDASRVAGWYWATRRENRGPMRLLYMLGQTRVAALPNGDITVSLLQYPSGAPKEWREIGPLLYQQVGGQSRLRFVTGTDRSIRWWTTDALPPVEIFQPVRGLAQHNWFVLLTSIVIAVFVLTLLVWIGGAIVRRHFRKKLELLPRHFPLRLAARMGVVLQLALVVGWLILLVHVSQPLSLFHGFNGGLIALYILGVLGVLGGIAIILDAAWRVARGPGGLLARGSEVVLGLCAVYGIWAIFAYGLIAFNFNY